MNYVDSNAVSRERANWPLPSSSHSEDANNAFPAPPMHPIQLPLSSMPPLSPSPEIKPSLPPRSVGGSNQQKYVPSQTKSLNRRPVASNNNPLNRPSLSVSTHNTASYQSSYLMPPVQPMVEEITPVQTELDSYELKNIQEFAPPPTQAIGDDESVTKGEFKKLHRQEAREINRPFWRNKEGWHNTGNNSIMNGLGHVWNQKIRIGLFGVGYVINGINFYLVKNRTSYLDNHYGQLFCEVQQVAPFLSDPSQCDKYLNEGRSIDSFIVKDDIQSKSKSLTACIANDIYRQVNGKDLLSIENPEDCDDFLDNNKFSQKQLDSFARHHGINRDILNNLTTSVT